MSVFVPIPHCFDYCSFVVLSEVWEGYASCFVLFGKAFLKHCKAIKDENIPVYEKYKHSTQLLLILSQGCHETSGQRIKPLDLDRQCLCLQHFALENSTQGVLGQMMCPPSTHSPL